MGRVSLHQPTIFQSSLLLLILSRLVTTSISSNWITLQMNGTQCQLLWLGRAYLLAKLSYSRDYYIHDSSASIASVSLRTSWFKSISTTDNDNNMFLLLFLSFLLQVELIQFHLLNGEDCVVASAICIGPLTFSYLWQRTLIFLYQYWSIWFKPTFFNSRSIMIWWWYYPVSVDNTTNIFHFEDSFLFKFHSFVAA